MHIRYNATSNLFEISDDPTDPEATYSQLDLDASQLTHGTVNLARLSNIADAQISASAAIAWSKISKSGSSLADLATRSAGDLSSGTLLNARLTAGAIYNPSWTGVGTPDIGNGTIAGRFVRHGQILKAEVNFTMGSTTTYGTAGSRWDIGLPSGNAMLGANRAVGSAMARDSNTGTYYVGTLWSTGITTFAVIFDANTVPASNGVPFSWANGDTLFCNIIAEVSP